MGVLRDGNSELSNSHSVSILMNNKLLEKFQEEGYTLSFYQWQIVEWYIYMEGIYMQYIYNIYKEKH